MKHLRITLILLIACAAVGVYVFFYERGKPPEQAAAKRFDPAKVQRVELKPGTEGKSVVMERTKGQWRITGPVSTRAEQGRVDALVEKLAWLAALGEVAMPEKPDEYGLGNEAGIITVSLEGDKEVVLRVGHKTADKGAAYATIDGGEKALLVDPSLLDDLSGGLDLFRSRQMVTVDRNKVHKISIVRGPELITLEKVRDEWRLTQPVRAHADEEKLEMVLVNASTLRSLAFVEDEPKDLAKYGLSQPRLKVELHVKGRRAPTLLHFGNELETRNVFARTSEDKAVFLAGKIQFDSVNRPLSDLRSKRMITFDPDQAQQVLLTAAGKRLELRRKPGGDGKWEITAPTKMAADSGEVEDLVFLLSRLKAESFIYDPAPMSTYGLDTPSLEALVWLKGVAQPKRLALGKQANGTFFGVATAEAGVARIDDYIAGRIAPDLGVYREKTMIRFDRRQARKLSITRAGKRITLERKRGGWHITEPVQALGDAATIDSILFTLQDLTGDRLVSDEPTDLAQYGLDKPRIEAEIGFPGKQKPITLYVGKEAPGDRVYVMLKAGRAVYAKDNWILPYLEKEVSDFRR